MDSVAAGALMACWLGILTSVSPCPLATNIAAISYIGNKLEKTSLVLVSGGFYILGRMAAYTLLGIILVAGLLSISNLSNLLQRYANLALGPILLVTGLFLLGAFRLNFAGPGVSDRMRVKAESFGIRGAFVIGFLFALSFCPISAALYFGSLIPLAAKHQSSLLFPSIYGIGTGLPVFLFAILIALGARYVGIVFNRLTMIELWARRITGVVFLAVGVYYSLIYIFRLDL